MDPVQENELKWRIQADQQKTAAKKTEAVGKMSKMTGGERIIKKEDAPVKSKENEVFSKKIGQ